MKILHVICTMDPAAGGLAQALRNMVPALTAKGVHNEVLSFDPPGADFLGQDAFVVHAIGPAKGPYRYCAGLQPWLLQQAHRFDVVIAHGLWQHNNAGTASALSHHRRRHVAATTPAFYVMPHGMLDPYFQRAPDRRWKAVRNQIVWKLLEGRAVNGAQGVLFTCAQELLLARIPFKPYRPQRELDVGLGIQAPPPRRDELLTAFHAHCPALAGRPYLLFLSRVHEKKGVDLLLGAYLQLQRERADLPALVVAGPGMDTVYGRSLRDMAGQAPDIHFTGMLSGDVKWGAIHGCEAFVLPSHQENFGIAVVEAMACERPVLISNQVNIWKECEPGGLVDDDTAEGTLRLLSRWLALAPAQRAALGVEARKAYLQNFSVEGAAQRLRAALEATRAS
ncbi:MAG: glycosyltransferase [Variovorax sp.]|nr:MAG: glycosyltransferase [Variovorax sp.]